jgi:hypothetical protein
MNIPDRVTIRLNEKEKLKLKQLGEFLNEEDLSKLLKFSLDTSIHHLKYVTEALINPEWDVIFQRKRKTNELKRKLY